MTATSRLAHVQALAAAPLRVLDLFSGIGGFSLGLERAGFRTVAFCEIDPFCRRVLAKHWPEVSCYDDVRTVTADRLRADGIIPDAICGGFPCQDISTAGNGEGIDGARSGLWAEYARLIGEINPRYVVVENVAALLGRGIDRVLRDLAAVGYDAEWHCIPASAVGAPHRRDRVWIVAYASQLQCHGRDDHDRCGRQSDRPFPESRDGRGSTGVLANPNRKPSLRLTIAWPERDSWPTEPDVGRVVNGVPDGVDRLRILGNAVVPQIPELIGRAILASEAANATA